MFPLGFVLVTKDTKQVNHFAFLGQPDDYLKFICIAENEIGICYCPQKKYLFLSAFVILSTCSYLLQPTDVPCVFMYYKASRPSLHASSH